MNFIALVIKASPFHYWSQDDSIIRRADHLKRAQGITVSYVAIWNSHKSLALYFESECFHDNNIKAKFILKKIQLLRLW